MTMCPRRFAAATTLSALFSLTACSTDSHEGPNSGVDSGVDATGTSDASNPEDARADHTAPDAGTDAAAPPEDAAVASDGDAAAGDGGGADAEKDGTTDSAASTAADSGFDAAFDASSDATTDSGHDAAGDSSFDGGHDAAGDSGFDSGTDAAKDAGLDAPGDAGVDAGPDSSVDATIGGGDAGLPIDAGADTAADGGCASTVVLFGGSQSGAFAATRSAGAWTVQSFADASVIDVPAIASLGSSWLAVGRGNGDGLLSAGTSGAVWGAPASIGSATTIGAPALTAVGAAGNTVYLGSNGRYYHGTFATGTWDSAGDPAGGSGSAQFAGADAPSVATVAGSMYLGFVGNDGNLYVGAYDGGGWHGAVQAASGGATTVSPRLVALTGGADDLLLVFARTGDVVLEYATRDATSKVWSSTHLVGDGTVYTANPVAMAPLPSGSAYLLYEGGDGQPYQSTYASGGFGPVLPLFASNNPVLSSPPQVARGVCGADILAAYAVQDAGIHVVGIRGDAATDLSPTSISGSFVAIEARP